MDRKENLKAAAKLDIFGTDLPKTSPIFAYFSGGYWQVTRKLKDHLWVIKTTLTKILKERITKFLYHIYFLYRP